MLGEQENSIDIGALGDKIGLDLGEATYTIDWAAPEVFPILAGAELYNEWANEDMEFSDILGTLSALTDPIVELSMLDGLNSALDTVKYSQSSSLSAVLGNTVSSYLSQGVPTLGGKVARSIDDTSRQTYYDPNKTGIVREADVFRQKVQAKIPGLENMLQPRVDLWGREEENAGGGGLGRTIYNMLSPGYLETNKETYIDRELKKLAEETGNSNVLPDTADKTFKVGTVTKKLTAEEYTEYAKEKGSKAYEIFDSIIGTSTWSSLSNEEKADVASKVYEYANAIAKSEVSDYELRDTAAKFKACEDAGIPAGVAIVAYEAQKGLKGDKDADGDTIPLSAAKKKKAAVDGATPFLNQNQRIKLYDVFDISEKVW
jgi:hypothetical protein